jgi:hypothetical protein
VFLSTQYAFANTARETSLYSKTILKHAYIQSPTQRDKTELSVVYATTILFPPPQFQLAAVLVPLLMISFKRQGGRPTTGIV